MKTYTLLLVGHGNMGAALLAGWRDAGLIGQAVVVEPHCKPSPDGQGKGLPAAEGALTPVRLCRPISPHQDER